MLHILNRGKTNYACLHSQVKIMSNIDFQRGYTSKKDYFGYYWKVPLFYFLTEKSLYFNFDCNKEMGKKFFFFSFFIGYN